jgi:prophage DNA circulation protein
LPSLLGILLTVHSSLLITVANASRLRNTLAALTSHRAVAAPANPLDDLLHLPPKAAPVQEAIDLIKNKPLEAAVTPEQ